MALSAGQTYVDIVPRVDSRAVKRQGLSIGKSIATGVAAVAAVDFFRDSLQAARESRQIAAVTASAIKATGGAANVSAEQVAGYAEQLAGLTGVDDEVIQKGENLLLTFRNIKDAAGEGNDIFKRATEAGLDLAAQGFGSGESNAIHLGQALNDPIKGSTALQRAGVTFTQTQRDQIEAMVEANDVLGAQKIILDEVENQVGGAAEAAADPLAKLAVVAGNLQEDVGSALLPTLDNLASRFTDLSPKAQENIVKWGLLATGAGAAAVGISKVVDAAGTVLGPLGGIADKFREARSAGAGFGASLGSAAKGLAGPAGVAVALTAATVIYTSFTKEQRDAKAATEDFTAALKADNGAIRENTRETAANLAEKNGLFEAAQLLGVETATVVDAMLGEKDAQKQIAATVKRTEDAYFGLNTEIRNAPNEEERDRLQGVQAAMGDQQKAAQDLRDTIPSLNNSLQDAIHSEELWRLAVEGGTAAGDVAQRTARNLATETTELGTQVDFARVKTLDMADAVDRMSNRMQNAEDRAFGLRDATSAYQAAIDDAQAALDESNGSINLHSEEGRKADAALQALAISTNALTTQTYEDTGSRKDANAAADEGRRKLEKLGERYGLTKEQVRIYTGAVKNIPKRVDTRVHADTVNAQRRVEALTAALEGATAHRWDVEMGVRVGNAAALPKPKTSHEGGVVSPSWPTWPGLKSDERPAILQTGELVTPRGASSGVTINGDININSSDRPSGETLVSALRREAFLAGW